MFLANPSLALFAECYAEQVDEKIKLHLSSYENIRSRFNVTEHLNDCDQKCWLTYRKRMNHLGTMEF